MKGVYLKKGNTKVSVVPYYRIGDLFLTTIATNPSNFLGGKWELFGPGRCLVCVDTSDSDFNTVKKTGGSKYLQQHSHWQSLEDSGSRTQIAGYKWYFSNTGRWYDGSDLAGGVAGGWKTGNSGNLQPYITCYIWIRTA